METIKLSASLEGLNSFLPLSAGKLWLVVWQPKFAFSELKWNNKI